MDIQPLLENIFDECRKNEVPNISWDNAQYIGNIIQENEAKHMLEIGTAHGFSTIYFADILSKIWGNLTTIEFSQVSYEIAQKHIELSGLSNISQYFWDAREIIPLLDESYDFVFIDGMKKASLQFLHIVWNKVVPGGFIIIDDVIKFKHKMEDLYNHLEKESITYQVTQIDSDDGIMIIKK